MLVLPVQTLTARLPLGGVLFVTTAVSAPADGYRDNKFLIKLMKEFAV